MQSLSACRWSLLRSNHRSRLSPGQHGGRRRLSKRPPQELLERLAEGPTEELLEKLPERLAEGPAEDLLEKLPENEERT